MRTGLAAAAALLGTTVFAAQDARTSSSLERAFPSNGRVRMELAAGEYRIVGDAQNRIRMEWSVQDAASLAKVKARADVHDKEVSITTEGPSNKGLTFTILVPRQSDLYVRLSAGELRIDDIRGSKDVELHAGDARIDVGRAEDYNSVDASVWVGDLNAAPFDVFKGGLFRSFDWKGKGSFRLHAKLNVGDLRLFSKDDERRSDSKR